MEDNELSHIDSKAFESLTELKVALFADNRLTLDSGHFSHISPFHKCRYLQNLDLRFNSVTEIFRDWLDMSELHNLNLSYNKLDYLTVSTILC